MKSQMEEMHRARSGRRHRASVHSLGVPPSGTSAVQPAETFHSPFGALWKLHYRGMINDVIGHCNSTLSSSLLLGSLGGGSGIRDGLGVGDWKFLPSNHVVGSPGNQPSVLPQQGHLICIRNTLLPL